MLAERQPVNADTRPAFEVRAFSIDAINVDRRQQEDQPDELRISGHAAVFNHEANIAGVFREVIRPGAFQRAIEERQDVTLLLNHDPSTVMARVSNGTLHLSEDQIGLRFQAVLDPNDSDAVRTVAKIERGNITQMSFAFVATSEQWRHNEDPPLREIYETNVTDISPVTYPAYQQTDVHARALARMNGVQIPDPDALAGAPDSDPSLAARHRQRSLNVRRRKNRITERKGV